MKQAAKWLNRGVAIAAVLMAGVASANDEVKEPTPPTVVDEWNLDSDFAKIQQQWDRLLELAGDAKVFAYQTDEVSKWSVGKQVAHVGLVMGDLAPNLEALVENPEKGAGEEISAMAMPMLQGGVIPRGVGQAPNELQPPDDISSESVTASIKDAKKKWDAFSKQKDKLADIKGTHPHFALGPMTPSAWVRLAAIHTAHHLKIVDDIIAASK